MYFCFIVILFLCNVCSESVFSSLWGLFWKCLLSRELSCVLKCVGLERGLECLGAFWMRMVLFGTKWPLRRMAGKPQLEVQGRLFLWKRWGQNGRCVARLGNPSWKRRGVLFSFGKVGDKMAAVQHGWEAPAESTGAVVLLGVFVLGNVDVCYTMYVKNVLKRSRAMCFLWESVFYCGNKLCFVGMRFSE